MPKRSGFVSSLLINDRVSTDDWDEKDSFLPLAMVTGELLKCTKLYFS